MPDNNTNAYDYGESWFSVAGDVDDFIFTRQKDRKNILRAVSARRIFFRKWCRIGVNFRSFFRRQIAQPQPVRFHHLAADVVLLPTVCMGKKPMIIASAGDEQSFFFAKERRLRGKNFAMRGIIGLDAAQSQRTQLIKSGV